MRTKKQIEKMMIGMLLGGGCLLSSCHSVYMSAEDRLQGDYQEAVAEVELETVEELTAFAYSDVSVIPYTVENIARGFTDLSDEEIEKYALNLQDILEFAEVVNNAPVDGLDVTVGANEKKNVFRKDEIKVFKDNEALLQNAPSEEQHMFKIPKVIN